MSDVEDPRGLDPWSRLRHRVREIKEGKAEEILLGGCSPEEYQRYCGEHGMCEHILELMDEIGRGQDLRQPEKTDGGFAPWSIEEC